MQAGAPSVHFKLVGVGLRLSLCQNRSVTCLRLWRGERDSWVFGVDRLFFPSSVKIGPRRPQSHTWPPLVLGRAAAAGETEGGLGQRGREAAEPKLAFVACVCVCVCVHVITWNFL